MIESWLDSQEFYELMQAYRWADRSHGTPADTVAAFGAVKAYIRAKCDEAAAEESVEAFEAGMMAAEGK